MMKFSPQSPYSLCEAKFVAMLGVNELKWVYLFAENGALLFFSWKDQVNFENFVQKCPKKRLGMWLMLLQKTVHLHEEP